MGSPHLECASLSLAIILRSTSSLDDIQASEGLLLTAHHFYLLAKSEKEYSIIKSTNHSLICISRTRWLLPSLPLLVILLRLYHGINLPNDYFPKAISMLEKKATFISNLCVAMIMGLSQRWPEIPHLGWRTGRGTGKGISNRNVDLLCARPGDGFARSLASVHMIFFFNPRSGLFMLMGGSRKVPVEYKCNGVWTKLEHEHTRVLHQHSTTIRAANCEYELEYTIGNEFKKAFLEQRDEFINLTLPSDKNLELVFREAPGDNLVLRKKLSRAQKTRLWRFWLDQQGCGRYNGKFCGHQRNLYQEF